MKRFRVDIVVRELDVPEESARGLRVGDDVEDIAEYFNKIRDVARTMFQVTPPKKIVSQPQAQQSSMWDQALGREDQRSAIDLELAKARERRAQARAQREQDPYAGKSKSELDRMDDGSRGGDGPSDPRYVEAYRAATDPNRDRY